MDYLAAMLAFVRSVDLGSFSRAAAEAGLKVSTVSRYVSGLEADLGAALLNRSTRSLHVTEAGTLLTRLADPGGSRGSARRDGIAERASPGSAADQHTVGVRSPTRHDAHEGLPRRQSGHSGRCDADGCDRGLDRGRRRCRGADRRARRLHARRAKTGPSPAHPRGESGLPREPHPAADTRPTRGSRMPSLRVATERQLALSPGGPNRRSGRGAREGAFTCERFGGLARRGSGRRWHRVAAELTGMS
jgi:DNA-binding transcriptional LysR family regulator